MASPSVLSLAAHAGGGGGAGGTPASGGQGGLLGEDPADALSSVPKDYSNASRETLSHSVLTRKAGPYVGSAGGEKVAKGLPLPIHLPFLHRLSTPQAPSPSATCQAIPTDAAPASTPVPDSLPSHPMRCPRPPTLHLPSSSSASTGPPSPIQPSPSPSPSPASASCHGPLQLPRYHRQWPVPAVPSLGLPSASGSTSPRASAKATSASRRKKSSSSAASRRSTTQLMSSQSQTERPHHDGHRPASASSSRKAAASSRSHTVPVERTPAPPPLPHHRLPQPATVAPPPGDSDEVSGPSTPVACSEDDGSSFHETPVPTPRRLLGGIPSARSFFPPSASTPGKRVPASPSPGERHVLWLGSSSSTKVSGSRTGLYTGDTPPPAPSTPCTPSRSTVHYCSDREGVSDSERLGRFRSKPGARHIERIQSSDSSCESGRHPRIPHSCTDPSCSPAAMGVRLQSSSPGSLDLDRECAKVAVGAAAAAAAKGPVVGLLIADAGNGLIVGLTKSLALALGYADVWELQGRCVPELADGFAIGDWWRACRPLVSAARQSSHSTSSSACAEQLPSSSTKATGSSSGGSRLDASLMLRLLKSERKGSLVGRKVMLGVEPFFWDSGASHLAASHQDLVLLEDPPVCQKSTSAAAAGSFPSPARKPGLGRYSGKGLVLACVALASGAPPSMHDAAVAGGTNAPAAVPAPAPAPVPAAAESSASVTPTSFHCSSEQHSSAWSRSSAADGALGWSTETGGAFGFSRLEESADPAPPPLCTAPGEEGVPQSPLQARPDVPVPGDTSGRLEQLLEQEQGDGEKDCMGLDDVEEERWDQLVWKAEKMERVSREGSKTSATHVSQKVSSEVELKQQLLFTLKALSLSGASMEAPAEGGGCTPQGVPKSSIPSFLRQFDEKLKQRGSALASRLSTDFALEDVRRELRPPAAVQEGVAIAAWPRMVEDEAEWEEDGLPLPAPGRVCSSAVLRPLPSASKHDAGGRSHESPAAVPVLQKADHEAGALTPGKGVHAKGGGKASDWKKGGPKLFSWLKKTPFSRNSSSSTEALAEGTDAHPPATPVQPKGRLGRPVKGSLVAFSSPGGLIPADLPVIGGGAAAAAGGGGEGGGASRDVSEVEVGFDAPHSPAGFKALSRPTLMRRVSDLKERQAGAEPAGRPGGVRLSGFSAADRRSLDVSRKAVGSAQERPKAAQRSSSLQPSLGSVSDPSAKKGTVEEDAWGKPMRANWGEGEEEEDGEMGWFW